MYYVLFVDLTIEQPSKDEQDSSSVDDGEEGYSVSIPGVGMKKVKINTTQLEEKSLAARALYEHAKALGKDFGIQYIEVRSNVLWLSIGSGYDVLLITHLPLLHSQALLQCYHL